MVVSGVFFGGGVWGGVDGMDDDVAVVGEEAMEGGAGGSLLVLSFEFQGRGKAKCRVSSDRCEGTEVAEGRRDGGVRSDLWKRSGVREFVSLGRRSRRLAVMGRDDRRERDFCVQGKRMGCGDGRVKVGRDVWG